MKCAYTHLEINKHRLLLRIAEVHSWWLTTYDEWFSRTLEWEDMEWGNADPMWQGFFEENAL